MPIRETLLFTIAGGGLLMDLLQEKVDNRLICLGFGSGLILDIFYSGFAGILHKILSVRGVIRSCHGDLYQSYPDFGTNSLILVS